MKSIGLAFGAFVLIGCAASESTLPGDPGDDDGEGGSGNAPAQGGTDSGGSDAGGTSAAGTSAGGAGTGGTASGSGGTDSGGTSAGGTSAGGTTTGGSAGTATGGTAPTGGTGPSGTPSISLPYTDDFETSEAADWRTITFGAWEVTDDGGNNVYQLVNSMSDEEPAWAVGGDRNWTNVRLEARLKFVSEGSAGDGMIYLAARFARSPSDYNYYWVEYRSEGKLKVRRRDNGSSADIVTTEEDVIAGIGTWHTVAVTLSGANVTLEYDGVVVGMGTDSAPLTAGGIAVAATDSIVAIDDVSVTEAP